MRKLTLIAMLMGMPVLSHARRPNESVWAVFCSRLRGEAPTGACLYFVYCDQFR